MKEDRDGFQLPEKSRKQQAVGDIWLTETRKNVDYLDSII